MPMTVVVTRDVPDRFRGFLASVMLEIAPGVYTSPNLGAAVRDRIWRVLDGWHGEIQQGSVLMTWHDREASSGQRIQTLGLPAKTLVDHDGMILVKREIAP